MADVTTIVAVKRDRAGKGSARAARREGLVPAVIYGGKKKPEMITVERRELVRLMNRGGFMSHQYEIDVDGKKTRVLPRDLQVHPVTDTPIHVDFLRLTKGGTVAVEVPVHVVDQDDCPGLTRGGVLNMVRDTVELDVPSMNIPEMIEVSVKGMDVNDQIRISQAKLPEGCTPTITDRDFVVATISAPSAMKSAEGEEAEGEEAEEEGGEE
ncbi:large subunit ribosomal protein L25 [Rhodothalassium salexigens DSM 2132]|uniref:Large ribosomal subunit protein bL25 n=1 Tax=Rhodothalassium salexigens DSM 2132 TaxID=1188247 RepID=A0A4R2PBN2_RHOSA|nr:50S ribosomal protein L25/general stress protein Ctc [Rhodothalassium salexigens]MBB4212320.1 large subunit ribosomal protein L25 [Rhodothalassium salexigens DSM 2132]MBK1638820.1 50S ribosomal protein L25/general stress protein Ctc [Rhodothalassium salexigens DSM 2132]TCP32529.1 large subunit ribosomal protein L25 [Rhodothalassium salexigens DSM 2132]